MAPAEDRTPSRLDLLRQGWFADHHLVSDSRIFSVDVRHLDGSVAVALAGEFDLTGSESFDAAVRTLTSRYDASQITLDLSKLVFIDGSGIEKLVLLSRMARSGQVKLVGASGFTREVLAWANTLALFDVQASIDA